MGRFVFSGPGINYDVEVKRDTMFEALKIANWLSPGLVTAEDCIFDGAGYEAEYRLLLSQLDRVSAMVREQAPFKKQMVIDRLKRAIKELELSTKQDDTYQFNHPRMEVVVQQFKTHYGIFWNRTKIGTLYESDGVWSLHGTTVTYSQKKNAVWTACALHQLVEMARA